MPVSSPSPARSRTPCKQAPTWRLLSCWALAALAVLCLASNACALGATPMLGSAPSGSAPASGAASVSGAAAWSSDEALPASAGAEGVQALGLLIGLIPVRYASAQPTHDVALAATARQLLKTIRQHLSPLRAALGTSYRTLNGELSQLQAMLGVTTQRFEPWPLTLELEALANTVQHQLMGRPRPAHRAPATDYAQIEAAFTRAQKRANAGEAQAASFALLDAYALYASGPGQRLGGIDPSLDGKLEHELLTTGNTVRSLMQAAKAAQANLQLTAQALGEVHISRTTIVVNGAILVFREGLEAVLILAAITASFAGARRRMRKPVLAGAFAGLISTILTWIVAQVLLHLLGDGGLRLQAITGLVAIAVLLLVTNWFFHRVYWSEWIARFNRRRKALEHIDKTGFLSGQALGLVLLGLSSVYREGLETVLFLQALQTSAGTGATALGAGIGLTATLLVAAATFKLHRKLPFKRMLILTGVLIALVLAVMVGTTIHNLQAIGWLPTTPTSFTMSPDWSTWLGAYPTWETIFGQLASLAFVVGSYYVARELQINRRRRHATGQPQTQRRTAAAAVDRASPTASLSGRL
jgi:high-affinity iron transporter